MALADRAILSLVETYVFGPDVIRAVLRDVMRHLQQTGTKASVERVALESAAKKLDRQQQNILNAIADGGESRSLRVKLKEIEEQQAEVADRLRRLTGLLGLQRQDLASLEATVLLKL